MTREDVRKFSLKVADGNRAMLHYDMDKIWPVLEAIEAAAQSASVPSDLKNVKEVVFVEHATGNFKRPTVEEAKAAIERNGYLLSTLSMGFMEELNSHLMGVRWIQVGTWDSHWGRGVDVEVTHGTEVEVNGVYTMLEGAANAALRKVKAGQPVSPRPVTPAQRVWATLTGNPLISTIVGGVVVALIIAYFGIDASSK